MEALNFVKRSLPLGQIKLPLKVAKSQSRRYSTWLSKTIGFAILFAYLILVANLFLTLGTITDLDEDIVPYKTNKDVAWGFNSVDLVDFMDTNNDIFKFKMRSGIDFCKEDTSAIIKSSLAVTNSNGEQKTISVPLKCSESWDNILGTRANLF